MNTIRKEVFELIGIHEKIQSVMSQGEPLTEDEKGLIEMCASELLVTALPQNDIDQ